jgi:hypothetical protein
MLIIISQSLNRSSFAGKNNKKSHLIKGGFPIVVLEATDITEDTTTKK